MRRCLLLTLTSVLVLTASAPAQENPRAVVARAVAAMGGADKVAQLKSARIQLQGTIPQSHIYFETSIHRDSAERLRCYYRLEITRVPMQMLFVLNNGTGWMCEHNTVTPLDPATIQQMRSMPFTSGIPGLLDLLQDKKCRFLALGETRVKNKKAIGVSVQRADDSVLGLYFDKASGLLVKVRALAPPASDGHKGPRTQEAFFSDYRPYDPATVAEQLLLKHGQTVTGPELAAWLRQQIPPADVEEQARRWIRQLGSDSFKVRVRAQLALQKLGKPAAPLLREATQDPDAEIAQRACECLSQLKKIPNLSARQIAAIQLLALRNPPGAARTLLDLYPTAGEAAVKKEVLAALYHLAHKDKTPDPVIVQAVHESKEACRQAARAVLGLDGGAYAKQPGRRLYVTGLRLPFRDETYIHDKLETSSELVQVDLFNALEESLFARPDADALAAPQQGRP